MTTLPPSWYAFRPTVPSGGFPALLALVGSPDAVVDRIADQVRQRIGNLLDHLPVQLGILAGNLDGDLLAQSPPAKSRTTRGKRRKTLAKGTMRTDITAPAGRGYTDPSSSRPPA